MTNDVIQQTIFTQGEEIVFVNKFFASTREDQEWLIQELKSFTEDTMSHQPGFISAALHKSFDGLTVINYARWRSADDFKRATENPAMEGHRQRLGGRFRREGALGTVAYTCIAEQGSAEAK
jgi:heme-degrading monooxygenase HmoA